MDQDLSIPFLGTVEWRSLYVSCRGPRIDHSSYLVQGSLVLIATVLVYRLLRGACEPA